MRGEHTENGTVTKIDHQTGKVTLKTELAPLQLHFPPGTLKGVNEGDTLTVQLGYTVTQHKPKVAKEIPKVAK